MIRDNTDFFLPTGWEYFYHPDITRNERRRYRPVYSASENIAAAVERYFIQEGKYYQSLRAQSPGRPSAGQQRGRRELRVLGREQDRLRGG